MGRNLGKLRYEVGRNLGKLRYEVGRNLGKLRYKEKIILWQTFASA